ncbi:MAG: prepilin peptidase [Porticoccaceae bacterium]
MQNLNDLLALKPIWSLLPALLLGAILGSFYNVVIARLPVMLQRQWQDESDSSHSLQSNSQPGERQPFNLFVPRSRCPNCHATVRALDNIPLLSFALLRGRCRSCQQSIHWRYPAIEFVSALLTALATWHFSVGPTLFFAIALIGISLILFAIDSEYMLLPDTLTLGLLWLGLLANTSALFTSIESAVYGAALGYGVLWILFWVAKWLTGQDAMGYGDFKYLAAIGAWFGPEGVLLGLLIASTLGSLSGLGARFFGHFQRYQKMPFGPFLSIAAVTLLFAQPTLSGWLWGGLYG